MERFPNFNTVEFYVALFFFVLACVIFIAVNTPRMIRELGRVFQVAASIASGMFIAGSLGMASNMFGIIPYIEPILFRVGFVILLAITLLIICKKYQYRKERMIAFAVFFLFFSTVTSSFLSANEKVEIDWSNGKYDRMNLATEGILTRESLSDVLYGKTKSLADKDSNTVIVWRLPSTLDYSRGRDCAVVVEQRKSIWGGVFKFKHRVPSEVFRSDNIIYLTYLTPGEDGRYFDEKSGHEITFEKMEPDLMEKYIINYPEEEKGLICKN